MVEESCVCLESILQNSLSKLGYSRIKIDHKIYHFIADSLLKDEVLTKEARALMTSSFRIFGPV